MSEQSDRDQLSSKIILLYKSQHTINLVLSFPNYYCFNLHLEYFHNGTLILPLASASKLTGCVSRRNLSSFFTDESEELLTMPSGMFRLSLAVYASAAQAFTSSKSARVGPLHRSSQVGVPFNRFQR